MVTLTHPQSMIADKIHKAADTISDLFLFMFTVTPR